MGLFQEYLDSKGKVRKPVVDASGGDPYPKTPPAKPPKEHGNKPYANSDDKGVKNKKNKGFGDQGDQDLVFKFDPKNKGKAPAKIPTVEQHELANLTARVAGRDPSFLQKLVYEMKMQGVLGPLVAELMEHKATFNYMTELMENGQYGPEICSRFNRALNGLKAEEVAPPFINPST